MEPIPTVGKLDLERFMGTWYVLAHIPIPFTGNAYNAVERYKLNDDGTVDVLYTYLDGGFEGELKTANPTGFPSDGDNDGEWGMRFVWPFKADYRVSYIDEDYSRTIIGRDARDCVWIMARTPSIADAEFEALARRVEEMGYEHADLEIVPQQPLAQRDLPEVVQSF